MRQSPEASLDALTLPPCACPSEREAAACRTATSRQRRQGPPSTRRPDPDPRHQHDRDPDQPITVQGILSGTASVDPVPARRLVGRCWTRSPGGGAGGAGGVFDLTRAPEACAGRFPQAGLACTAGAATSGDRVRAATTLYVIGGNEERRLAVIVERQHEGHWRGGHGESRRSIDSTALRLPTFH